MPISFSNIPANLKIPLYWVEVDPSKAGLPVLYQPSLIVGVMIAATKSIEFCGRRIGRHRLRRCGYDLARQRHPPCGCDHRRCGRDHRRDGDGRRQHPGE